MKIRNRPLIALMPLLFVATASLALADPPSWAPAHGYRAKHQHHYVYYPNGEVYYAPARHMWFWLSGNGWQAGVDLPLALRAYVRVGGVHVSLDAARPYERHAYVERRYGGHRVYWRRHDRDEHGHGHHGRHDDD
jgi:hypothetical protein